LSRLKGEVILDFKNLFKPNDILSQAIKNTGIEQAHKNTQRITEQIAQKNYERDEREKELVEYSKQSAKTAQEMYEYARWAQIESAKEIDTSRTIAGVSLLVSVISIIVSIIIAAID
jgi:hypothetical protein